MRRTRLGLALGQRFGPRLFKHWPTYRQFLQQRQTALHKVPSDAVIRQLLCRPLLVDRLTGYAVVRRFQLAEFTNDIEQALQHQRRFIERIHLYATLQKLGQPVAYCASPYGHRRVLSADGPIDLALACNETSTRIERAVELLLQLDVVPPEPLNLKGLSRHERISAIQVCGLRSDIKQLPLLVEWLFRMDIDPGHGFAFRGALVEAIGRMGIPVGYWLHNALIQEALEFEGRPGAGLGIQRPVRRQILSAFGESEATKSSYLTSIVDYLGNQTGSASAGFYVEGMNILWKWMHPQLEFLSVRYPRQVRQNALGVLATYQKNIQIELDDVDRAFWIRAQQCHSQSIE